MSGRTTLAEIARVRLRQEILEQARLPGAPLAEGAVSRELKMSRVPIREALVELERDGLVRFSSTGRAYVKTLQPEDLQELFVLRLALEPLGARLAVPALKRDASCLESILAASRRASTCQELTRLDLDFHQAIVEASGNTRLVRLWKSLRGELELWLAGLHRQLEQRTRQTRQATVADHEKLLSAFQKQSPAVVERLMRQHIAAWGNFLP